MNLNNDHIDSKNLLTKEEELFSKMDVPFEKSKNELWEELTNKIDLDRPSPMGKQIYVTWQRVAAVAAVLLVAFTTVFVFETTEVTSLPGEQLAHVLPDNSKVFLNAGTKISYYPNLWRFQRELNLTGEAFFEVEKGEAFTVVSEKGKTEVVGTSFNIYARKGEYEVFCKTGKVKVSNYNKQSELLLPNQIVQVNADLELLKLEDISEDNVLFWREGKLKFVSRKLPLVLEELERQYNTTIQLKGNSADQLTYTGYFTRDKNIESVLDMMAMSLNLKVKKTNDGVYHLKK